MAPTTVASHDKDKRLKVILAFGNTLESQLPTAVSSKSISTLNNDTEKQILSFPSKFNPSSSARCEEIDRCGTLIWNLCTRLRRDFDSDRPEDMPAIIVLARVFAYFMLDCAHQCGRNATGNLSRLMKIGIKAGKTCLEQKQYHLATMVLTKVGGYEVLLKNFEIEVAKDERELSQKLLVEYYILRTVNAWYTNQFSIAELMFEKSVSSEQSFDPSTAENLADTLYELGKDLLGKEQYDMAAKWLGRAYDILNSQDLDRMSMDANELRVSIIQSRIKACLGLQSNDLLEQAQRLLDLLENELGDKLVVLLLKLEMLSRSMEETFNCGSYSDIIQKLTRSLPLTDANFRLIMFHIRKLNDKSPSLACNNLDEFLELRLLRQDRDDWLEKVLITRLWMVTNQRDNDDVFKMLDKMFSKLAENAVKPISASATLAAHTLLWKKIDSNYSQNQYDFAEKWCQLAMHRIFEKSGELNMARISRKLLLCALARKDIGNAREVFSAMPEAAQNEPLSRFLMYKIAVRCGETDLAAECLETISSSTTKDPTLLYACCLDAKETGNKFQLLTTLQLVLEKYGYDAPSGVHLPSLLRLTIGLMTSIIEGTSRPEKPSIEETVGKLCSIFEKAASSMGKDRRLTKSVDSTWTLDELDWFSKNSYNLAIKHLSIWHPRHTLRILQSCIEFINHYPIDVTEQIADDLSLRKMFCEFSAATALVALARGEDNVQTQLQDYLKLRKHVDNFDNLIQEKLDKLAEEAQQDLGRKLSILAAFDFEAACHLKAWDDLGDVIHKADMCKSSQVYEIMADIILCSEAPTHVLITTLKKIINEAWVVESSLDTTKLAKYMRCLFQIAIVDNVVVAGELLDQVHSLAEEVSESDEPYPAEELEWIATRAFNHAVDLYCNDDDEGCKTWAGKALNIAHFCADGGALERTLQSKLMSLKFDS